MKNARGVKCSTVIVGLDVGHVILDSELTVNAPTSVTVWCGIDALSHGLEGLLAEQCGRPVPVLFRVRKAEDDALPPDDDIQAIFHFDIQESLS